MREMFEHVRSKGIEPLVTCAYQQLQVEPTDENDLAEGTVDFHAFSHYNPNVVTTHEMTDTVGGNFQVGARNECLTYSDWGLAMHPTGLL